MSLSAASCKAGVYARWRLKTIGNRRWAPAPLSYGIEKQWLLKAIGDIALLFTSNESYVTCEVLLRIRHDERPFTMNGHWLRYL